MSDDTDSWLQNAFGLNVAEAARNVVEVVAPAAQAVANAGASASQSLWNVGETKVEGIWDAGVAGVQGVEAAGAAMVAPPPAEGSFGDAVSDTASREYNLAESLYTGAAGVYDAVVPNYSKLSQGLNEEVDAGEDLVKQGNAAAVAEFGDVPIVGSAVRGMATINNPMAEAAGGLVKGAGDLGAMAGNLVFHPVDSVSSVQEGALNLAEHVPVGLGIGTAVKGVHGLVDLARGKTDGKYGSTLSDLGENLRDDTQQDPNDPSKRVNTDVEFAASFGGGRKAWSDRPAEAVVRTLTNLAPMLLGDEAMKVPEEIPPASRLPESPIPQAVLDGQAGGLPGAKVETAMPEAQGGAFAEADTQIPDTQGNDFADSPTESPVTQGRRVARTIDMKIPESEGGDFARADTQYPQTLDDGDLGEPPITEGRRVARTVDTGISESEGGDFVRTNTRIQDTPGDGDFAEAPSESPPLQGGRVAKTVDGPPPPDIERVWGKPRKPAPRDSSLSAESAQLNYSDAARLYKETEAAEIEAIQDAGAVRFYRPREGFKGDPSKWNPTIEKQLMERIADKRAATWNALEALEASQDALKQFFKDAGIKVPENWNR